MTRSPSPLSEWPNWNGCDVLFPGSDCPWLWDELLADLSETHRCFWFRNQNLNASFPGSATQKWETKIKQLNNLDGKTFTARLVKLSQQTLVKLCKTLVKLCKDGKTFTANFHKRSRVDSCRSRKKFGATLKECKWFLPITITLLLAVSAILYLQKKNNFSHAQPWQK